VLGGLAQEVQTTMTATFTLPIFNLPAFPHRATARPQLNEPEVAPTRIEWVERQGRALHPVPFHANGEVLALNLARGCWHRCCLCAARANPSYPGDGVIQVYGHTPQIVEEELASRSRPPRAVLISPSTDPFPPSSEVQAETVRVVHVLAKRGIEAWLQTRGFIRPFARKSLAPHASAIKVLVGLTTLERSLQRLLERGAASPRLRIRQIARLLQSGIRVQVATDPLIPGLTDTRVNLEPLLAKLSGLGVRQVTAGYMFLRPGITENLQAVLRPRAMGKMVLDPYTDGPILAGDGMPPARYLPKSRRQRGYAALMTLASQYGINVQVNALSNPDFAPARATTSESVQEWLRIRKSSTDLG
jgi:DNA repair photolyase